MMKVEVRNVTPGEAEVILDTRNGSNRRLSSHVVKKYAREISEGRWSVHHQGIAFDEAGELVDGQHRLAAVVQAGIPAPFLVAYGVPRDSFSVMDVGKRRSAGDLIGANGNNIAAAVRIIRRLTGEAAPGGSSHTDALAGNDQVLATLEEWPEVRAIYGDTDRAARAYGGSTSVLVAVAAVALRTPFADRVEPFLDGLRTGVGLAADDPRLLLRNRVSSERAAMRGSRHMALTLVVKAWNAYAVDQGLPFLRYTKGEAVPAVVGFKK